MADQHENNMRFIARFGEVERRIYEIEIILDGLRKLLQTDLENKAKDRGQ